MYNINTTLSTFPLQHFRGISVQNSFHNSNHSTLTAQRPATTHSERFGFI